VFVKRSKCEKCGIRQKKQKKNADKSKQERVSGFDK